MTIHQAITGEMRSTSEYVLGYHISGTTSWVISSTLARSGSYSIRKSGRPIHGGVNKPGVEVLVHFSLNSSLAWGDSFFLAGLRENPVTPGDWKPCIGVLWDTDLNEIQIWSDSTGPFSAAATFIERSSISAFTTPIYRCRSWLDFSFYMNKTTGTVTMYIDGQQYMTWVGGALWLESVGVWDSICVLKTSSIGWNSLNYVDDFYVEAVSGDQVALSRRFFMERPGIPGGSTQWTPDSGTNYSRVNETGVPDGDTSYVETDTSAQKDLYGFDNLSDPISNYDIHEVYMQSEFKNVDDGEISQATYDHVVDDGSLESTDGPFSNSVLDTYTCYIAYSAFALQPDGTAWNLSDYNAWEYGIETN